MADTVAGIAFYAVVVLAMLAALRAVAAGGEPSAPRPSAAAVGLWLVVAVPSLVQLAVPALLPALERDAERIRAGQVWRLVTSAVVQDGGVVGTVSNLVILAVAAVAAERYWGGRRSWVTFWVAVVGADLLVLGVEPVGGGNSMATLALACAVASNVLASPARRWAWPPAVGALVAVGVLGAAANYHALACALGLLLGLVPPWGPRPRSVSVRGRRAPSRASRPRPSG